MPIIKSSVTGENITVIIFTQAEVDALVHILEAASIPAVESCNDALDVLDEFVYGLGIRINQ